ncbi:hypothetical protein GJ496_006387 [Pomphorhynchus laevis]|nr:hypothetical protein GJ496_006387 [Pomphorhynchus laevis]
MLKKIESEYRRGRISKGLFNIWLGLNGGAYQMNDSVESMKLWKEAIKAAKQSRKTSLENIDIIKMRSSFTDSGDFVKTNLLQLYQSIGMKQFRIKGDNQKPAEYRSVYKNLVYSCPIHGLKHIRITKNITKSRKHLMFLNELFRWATRGEKTKTNLDMASLVFQAVKGGYLDVINEALGFLPIGLWNITVAAVLIMFLGSGSIKYIKNYMTENKLCCLHWKEWHKVWKPFSIAVRHTANWHDGNELSLDDISHLAYCELPIGRDLNKSDWVQENKNRTSGERPLLDIFGLDSLTDLKCHLDDIIREYHQE